MEKTQFLAHFGPILPIFGAKKISCKMSCLTAQGILASCQNSEKIIKTQFQENAWIDGRTDRRTDPVLSDPTGYHRGSKKLNK